MLNYGRRKFGKSKVKEMMTYRRGQRIGEKLKWPENNFKDLLKSLGMKEG
jgi:hypothetical protein